MNKHDPSDLLKKEYFIKKRAMCVQIDKTICEKV